jgi:hypothetical protein
LEPKLKYITPFSASSMNFWRSWKYKYYFCFNVYSDSETVNCCCSVRLVRRDTVLLLAYPWYLEICGLSNYIYLFAINNVSLLGNVIWMVMRATQEYGFCQSVKAAYNERACWRRKCSFKKKMRSRINSYLYMSQLRFLTP